MPSEYGWDGVRRNVLMRLVISGELIIIKLWNSATLSGVHLNVGFNLNSSRGVDWVFFGRPILFKNTCIWQWSVNGVCGLTVIATNEGGVQCSDGIIHYARPKSWAVSEPP